MSINEKLVEMTKGECQVCGIELDDKRRYYCDEHKVASKYQARIGEANTETIEIEKPKKTNKKDSSKLQTEMSDILLPILGGLINSWFLSPIDALDLDDDNTNKIINEYAISDEELAMIIKPVIRLLLTSDLTKNVSSKVVENSDIVEALSTAISIYQRQVSLKELVNNAINRQNQTNQSLIPSSPNGFIGSF